MQTAILPLWVDFNREFISSKDRLKAFLAAQLPRTGVHSAASQVAPDARQLITEMIIREEKDLPSNNLQQKYTLPDGNVVDLASERFCAPELYFMPVKCNF